MAANVTVTLGAALAGNFASSFKASDDAVKGLRATVRTLDAALSNLQKRSLALIQTMGGMSRVIRTTSAAQGQFNSTLQGTVAANTAVLRSNTRLRQSYADLTRSRTALNRASLLAPSFAGGGGRGAGAAAAAGGGAYGWGNFLATGGSAATIGSSLTHVGGLVTGGAVASALGIAETVKQASELDTILRKVAVTSEIGMNEIAGLKEQLIELSTNSATAQGTKNLGEALFILVSAGRDLRTQALPSLKIMGMVATAYEASMEDVARTTNTLLDNFLIAPQQMERAFDIIGKIEKEGKIKLKDFASILPTIGGIAHLNKITGLEGLASTTSALEVIAKQTATPGEAATRLEDLLSSMTQRMTQQAFANAGIDLEAKIKLGDSLGQNRLKTLVDTVQQYSRGDPFRIGELFRNKEAKDALSALIQFRGEWDKIGTEGLKASGYIKRDFESMRTSAANSFRSLGTSVFNLAVTVGDIFAPSVLVLARGLERVTQVVIKISNRFPLLTKLIGGVVVGLTVLGLVFGPIILGFGLAIKMAVGLNVALLAAVPVLRNIAILIPGIATQATAASAIAAGGLTGIVGRVFAFFTAAWASAYSYVAGAAVALAGLSGPAWITIAVIGAGLVAIGYAIFKVWQPLKAFFVGLWEGFSTAMRPALDALSEAFAPLEPVVRVLGDAISGIVSAVAGIFTPVSEASEMTSAWAQAGQALGTILGATVVPAVKLVASSIGWLLKQYEKVVGFFDRHPHLTKILTFGASDSVNPATIDKRHRQKEGKEDKNFIGPKNAIGEYYAARDRFIAQGLVKDTFGDDKVNVSKIGDALKNGKISKADVSAYISGQGKGKYGTDYDAGNVPQLQALIAAQAAESQAKVAATATTNNASTGGNNITIYVNNPGASAGEIADAVDTRLQKKENDTARDLRGSSVGSGHR